MNNFVLQSMSKPADLQWQAWQKSGVAQVIVAVQPDSWKGSWHEDPKVQRIISLKGTWFVEAMDGKRVNLGPGVVSVGEDLNTRPCSSQKGDKDMAGGCVTGSTASFFISKMRR